MKNKVNILLVSIIIFVMLAGCSTESSVEVSVLSGTYVLSEDEASMEMVIDLSEKRFAVNILGNEFLGGQVKIEDDKLIAVTDDEKFKYVFEIENEKTLNFIPEQSDSLVSVGGDSSTVDMSNGLKFTLVEE